MWIQYFLLASISFSDPTPTECVDKASQFYHQKMESLISSLQKTTIDPEDFEKQRQNLVQNLQNSSEDCWHSLAPSEARSPASSSELIGESSEDDDAEIAE